MMKNYFAFFTVLLLTSIVSCKTISMDVVNDKAVKTDIQTISSHLSSRAFEGNDSIGLIRISISNGQTFIPEWAFSKISTLKKVILSPKIKVIADDAFFSCKNLESINLDNVDSIGEEAFKATSLTSVKLNAKAVGEFAFGKCGKLQSIYFSSSIQQIGDFAFHGDSALVTVNIPNGKIGESAFMMCNKLEELTLCGKNTEVTEIGKAAFLGCKSLKKITLPQHLSVIHSMTFMNCESLEAITIPASVREIESEAFSGCTCLKKIVFENNNTKYQNNSFPVSAKIEYKNK